MEMRCPVSCAIEAEFLNVIRKFLLRNAKQREVKQRKKERQAEWRVKALLDIEGFVPETDILKGTFCEKMKSFRSAGSGYSARHSSGVASDLLAERGIPCCPIGLTVPI
jgi:hypothetical protein